MSTEASGVHPIYHRSHLRSADSMRLSNPESNTHSSTLPDVPGKGPSAKSQTDRRRVNYQLALLATAPPATCGDRHVIGPPYEPSAAHSRRSPLDTPRTLDAAQWTVGDRQVCRPPPLTVPEYPAEATPPRTPGSSCWSVNLMRHAPGSPSVLALRGKRAESHSTARSALIKQLCGQARTDQPVSPHHCITLPE